MMVASKPAPNGQIVTRATRASTSSAIDSAPKTQTAKRQAKNASKATVVGSGVASKPIQTVAHKANAHPDKKKPATTKRKRRVSSVTPIRRT